MSLVWEMMCSEERRAAVAVADQKYGLLMQGVPHEDLEEWLAQINKPEAERELLTTGDVAEMLGMADKNAVSKLCRTQGLPRVMVRGQSRFVLEDVSRWARHAGRKLNRGGRRVGSEP